MSVTNALLLGDALREINVIGETDTPSAEQGAYGLRQLNAMLEAWLIGKQINLGYFAQTDTTATCPIPDWSVLGVMAAVAIRMAPNYGKTVSVELKDKYDEGYGIITRQAALDNIQPMDSRHLPYGSGWWQQRRGDIINGP